MSEIPFIVPNDRPIPRYVRAKLTVSSHPVTFETKIQGLAYREVPCKVSEPHPWLNWLGSELAWALARRFPRLMVERDGTRTEEYWEDISTFEPTNPDPSPPPVDGRTTRCDGAS